MISNANPFMHFSQSPCLLHSPSYPYILVQNAHLLTYLLTYLPTYLFTYSMEQSSSWVANRFSAGQEIPHYAVSFTFFLII
jgi:hypothetical protein